ncbi:MAG TPA: hypothetical protein VNZ57_12400 [Longimicrobiales bacterium]|nr:hypothetical protein [Longimicrobiales bacterium]
MKPADDPLERETAPGTGSSDYWDTELSQEEEPDVSGTLFLVIFLLMFTGAIWLIVYLRLLER